MRIVEPDPVIVAYMDALPKAVKLRTLGLSYGAIATVAREYHDVHLSPEQWRHRLRLAGAVPRPRGLGTFNARRDRV